MSWDSIGTLSVIVLPPQFPKLRLTARPSLCAEQFPTLIAICTQCEDIDMLPRRQRFTVAVLQFLRLQRNGLRVRSTVEFQDGHELLRLATVRSEEVLGQQDDQFVRLLGLHVESEPLFCIPLPLGIGKFTGREFPMVWILPALDTYRNFLAKPPIEGLLLLKAIRTFEFAA